jgi:hypothetical protein
VKRLTRLVCGIVLLMSTRTLLAQRRGGHGAGSGRPPTGLSNTDDLKDFKRAIALQVTPDQVIQFQRLTKSTQADQKARKFFCSFLKTQANLIYSTPLIP